MQIQSNLGSTIAMAFDECAPHPCTREYMENSVARTVRWLERCKAEMARLNSLPDTVNPHQLLFGINQGGTFEDIRIAHADTISAMDCDGYAIGGLAVGESHEEMYRILDVTVPHLPENKPPRTPGSSGRGRRCLRMPEKAGGRYPFRQKNCCSRSLCP